MSAFYLSNVEEYLRQDGRLKAFCANAATLPVDEASVFVRSARSGTPDFGFELSSELGSMTADLDDVQCGTVKNVSNVKRQ